MSLHNVTPLHPPPPFGPSGEADHRIANSLAAISGLVRIRARAADDVTDPKLSSWKLPTASTLSPSFIASWLIRIVRMFGSSVSARNLRQAYSALATNTPSLFG